MAIFSRGDVRIRYEDDGDGDDDRPAVLCLAPGGLSASRVETWSHAPWNPLERLAGSYRLVAMDQRNTGTSRAPVRAGDGWGSWVDDQLSLMDHLGIDRFAVVGMCIGGAFILKMLEEAPERIAAAVAMQPIGLDGNRDAFREMFDGWRREITGDHPEAGESDWAALWDALYGADRLVWSVDDSFLPSVERPLLVLRGNDRYHPSSVSEKLAQAVPSASLVERWKDPDDVPAADAAVKEFLAEHAR